MLTVQVQLNDTNWSNRNEVADLSEADDVIAAFQAARNRAVSFDFIATFTGGPKVGDLPTASVRVIDASGTVVKEPVDLL